MTKEVNHDALSVLSASVYNIRRDGEKDIQKNLWFPVWAVLSIALINPGRLMGMTMTRATTALQLTPPLYL